MEKLTLAEFKKFVNKTKEQIQNHFMDEVYEKLSNLDFFGDIENVGYWTQQAIAVDLKTDDISIEEVYNIYLENLEENK